jgi:hypothetical protein
MGEWLLHLPALWMGLTIFASTYVIAAAVFWCTGNFIKDRTRVVDPGILSPLGVVFGLLVVFTGAQVWGDLERARSAVADEASALRDVLLLGNGLSESESSKLRIRVWRHIATAAKEEWPAMAQGRAVIAMPTALRTALQDILALPATDDSEKAALIGALQKALEARRQRIVISQSTVSGVRWLGLCLTGLCVLIGIALVHNDNRRNCRVALALFATGMAASILVVAAHSRPFNSAISPTLLHRIGTDSSVNVGD